MKHLKCFSGAAAALGGPLLQKKDGSFSFVWVASEEPEGPAPKVEEAGWANSETSMCFSGAAEALGGPALEIKDDIEVEEEADELAKKGTYQDIFLWFRKASVCRIPLLLLPSQSYWSYRRPGRRSFLKLFCRLVLVILYYKLYYIINYKSYYIINCIILYYISLRMRYRLRVS